MCIRDRTYSYRINNTGAVQTKVVTLGPIAPNAAATFATWNDLPARSVGGATVEGVGGGNIAVIVNDETFTLSPNRVTAYTCFPDQAKTNKVNLPLYKEYYPVSYTHLDVYKRQVLLHSCSWTNAHPGRHHCP